LGTTGSRRILQKPTKEERRRVLPYPWKGINKLTSKRGEEGRKVGGKENLAMMVAQSNAPKGGGRSHQPTLQKPVKVRMVGGVRGSPYGLLQKYFAQFHKGNENVQKRKLSCPKENGGLPSRVWKWEGTSFGRSTCVQRKLSKKKVR